jgi:proteasome lid subunit RPN8/RPN11
MDPHELAAALARTPHDRLLGIFHSHPQSPPVPSHSDLQTSWHTLPTYWIVSLQNAAAPTLRIYRLIRDGDSAAHTTHLTYRLCELSFLP